MSDELNMSSVTADPAPETAGKRAAPEEKPPKTPGKRAGLIIGIIAAVLVLAYAGCCVAANALYSHTAFPNTSVLGMDMSGLSAQEAEQRWTEQGSALLDGMTIRLTRDGQEIGSTTLSDLGVTADEVVVAERHLFRVSDEDAVGAGRMAVKPTVRRAARIVDVAALHPDVASA